MFSKRTRNAYASLVRCNLEDLYNDQPEKEKLDLRDELLANVASLVLDQKKHIEKLEKMTERMK